jgi:hypothetical protein
VKRLLERYRAVADPLRSERRVELALLVAGALLLLTVLYLAVRIALATAITPIAPAPDSVRVAMLQGPAVVPGEEREEIVRRPVFWAERKPVEGIAAYEAAQPQSAETGEQAAPRMKNVTVRGVYGSGERGGVILSVKDRELRLAVGEEIEGWRLEEISGDSATFVSGGVRDRRELLPLVIETPSRPAAEASQSARAAAPPAPAVENADREETLTLGGS